VAVATAPTPGSRMDGYRELFRNRGWLLWQTSATAANVGYSVYAISIPWFAYEVSGNFLVVGLVLFIEVGIYSLTFLVAPLVDRARNKRNVYLACYPAQAVAAGAIAVAIFDHELSVPLLLGLIAFISLLWDVAWAANNVAPALLLSREQLFRAEGLGTLLGGGTQLGGYAGGAVLVVWVGPGAGLLLYAALLAVATVPVLPLSIPSGTRSEAPYLSDFREGWRYFSGDAGAALRKLGSVELLRGFVNTAPSVLIVVLAAHTFADSSDAYGVLFVAWVIGGVAAALLLGEWNPRGRVGWILTAAPVAGGLLILTAVWPGISLVVGAATWFLFGAAGTAYGTAFYVYLRGAYPAGAVGRITGNLYLFTGSAGAVGAVVVGTLAGVWSAQEIGFLVAACLIAAGTLLFALPGIRRLAF